MWRYQQHTINDGTVTRGNHGVDKGKESVLIEDIVEKCVYLRLRIQLSVCLHTSQAT